MEFRAEPRAVQANRRPKYRESKTGNLMYDRRVMRGNTYGGIVVPGAKELGGSSVQGSSPGRPRRRRKYIRPEADSIFNIRPEVERREGIDLSQFLVSKEDALNDARVEVHVQSQTDKLDDLPPPAPYVPRKTGVDVSTQIEPEDNLFKFDLEVEPILEVLVGKTLEQSLIEVQEEEELAHLRGARRHCTTKRPRRRRGLGDGAGRAVKVEVKERHRLAELARVEREKDLEQKVWSSYMSKTLVEDDLLIVFDGLENEGVFHDPVRFSVEEQFMPWVLQMVGGNLDRWQTAGV